MRTVATETLEEAIKGKAEQYSVPPPELERVRDIDVSVGTTSNIATFGNTGVGATDCGGITGTIVGEKDCFKEGEIVGKGIGNMDGASEGH